MLAESIGLLEAEGPVAVTARRVASLSGTSTAAVYELYGDKAGLIRSIFYSGFSRLADRLDSLPRDTDARHDVVAVLEATRAFAVELPMLFDVMFARPFAEFDPTPADFDAAARIHACVIGRVAAWSRTTTRARATIDAAHALVALNRGLISSELSGLLGSSAAIRHRRRSLAIDSTLDGLEGRMGAS